MVTASSARWSLISATGKPSSSSPPSRYSRVRAWHLVGLTSQIADAATASGSPPWNVWAVSGRAPSTPPDAPAGTGGRSGSRPLPTIRGSLAASGLCAGPDCGEFIGFSSLQRRAGGKRARPVRVSSTIAARPHTRETGQLPGLSRHTGRPSRRADHRAGQPDSCTGKLSRVSALSEHAHLQVPVDQAELPRAMSCWSHPGLSSAYSTTPTGHRRRGKARAEERSAPVSGPPSVSPAARPD